MPGRVDQATQSAAIAKITENSGSAPAIREELGRLLASAAFQSSRRSQKFLQHVVESALAGNFDHLKERTIGAEIFSRSPAYDTNEDSIVRVTATDVRKRLAEHYSGAGRSSTVRIDLPTGSYLPEFRIHTEGEGASHAEQKPLAETSAPAPPVRTAGGRLWPVLAMFFAAAAIWAFIDASVARHKLAAGADALLPWSSLFSDSHRTYIVISDTSVAALQDLLEKRVGLSDYAGRGYLPSPDTLPPDTARAVSLLARNLFTSSADASVAARVAQTAGRGVRLITVRSAKSMQIREFRTDDDFILIGSAYANPWVELFSSRLGFNVEFDPQLRRQICRDRNPAQGAPAAYVPTAITGGAGEAFAVIAFLKNPGQKGHVLLIAGTNMEATEAAGEFVTDPVRISDALRYGGIAPDGQPAGFEALLKVTSLAGAASSSEMLAFRRISSR